MRAFVIPLILIQTTAFTRYQTSQQVGSSRFGEEIEITTFRHASAIVECHGERNVVVLSHNVSQHVLDGHYDVNCLLTGRVDVLCRCINSALWVSKGIRKNTTMYLLNLVMVHLFFFLYLNQNFLKKIKYYLLD